MSSDQQIAPTQQVKPYKKPYPPRKSRKPQAIKTAVIAKRANGANKASIARDLQITPNCVTAIVEESGIDRHLEDAQLQSVKLIPQAIRVAEHRLAQNSENMAIKVLENTIWPLNAKSPKPQDQGLTLAIQNLLLGNVTVQSTESKPVEQNKAIDVAPQAELPPSDK
jgi:hypothetical protein